MAKQNCGFSKKGPKYDALRARLDGIVKQYFAPLQDEVFHLHDRIDEASLKSGESTAKSIAFTGTSVVILGQTVIDALEHISHD